MGCEHVEEFECVQCFGVRHGFATMVDDRLQVDPGLPFREDAWEVLHARSVALQTMHDLLVYCASQGTYGFEDALDCTTYVANVGVPR